MEVPADLANIIQKCLSLDWSFRFRSGAELLSSLRRLEGRSAAPESGAGVPSPTVGRDGELTQVESFLRGVAEGGAAPRALLITAIPGMGQSHLMREVKVRAQKRGLAFHMAAGHPGQAARPGSLLERLGLHHAASGPQRRRSSARWRNFMKRLRQPRAASKDQTSEGERRSRRALEVALALEAVREPLLLAVDGLQHWDEVSQELFIDLVRSLVEGPGSRAARGEGGGRLPARPPVGVVVGYREEGPGAALLRELSASLLEPGRAEAITLGPLSLGESWRLYLERRGPARAVPGASPWTALGVYQETGGAPARIMALAAGADSRPAAGSAFPPRGSRETVRRQLFNRLKRLGVSLREERRRLHDA